MLITRQDVGLTCYLQSLWLRAYNGETFISDFTGEPNARIRSMAFYNALANYRKKVRKHKLNELYAREWARIDRVKLKRLSNTCFTLIKIEDYKYLKKTEARETSWGYKFNFPSSITYL